MRQKTVPAAHRRRSQTRKVALFVAVDTIRRWFSCLCCSCRKHSFRTQDMSLRECSVFGALLVFDAFSGRISALFPLGRFLKYRQQETLVLRLFLLERN